jgi:LmbE family N-acetylglucosaminyl deacetylase
MNAQEGRRRWGRTLAKWILTGASGLALWMELRTRPVPDAAAALQEGARLLAFRRVLAVAAHPDDLEWYAGGTLARMARAGVEVHVIVASDGERGPNLTGARDLRAERRREQAVAADLIGYRSVHMPGLPDRSVARGDALRRELEKVASAVRPDAVLTFDPEKPSLPYLHADHQGAGRIVRQWWREQGKGRPALYYWQTRRPDVLVDISEVMDVKLAARAAHRTQGTGRPDLLRSLGAAAGRPAGLASAEAFRRARR